MSRSMHCICSRGHFKSTKAFLVLLLRCLWKTMIQAGETFGLPPPLVCYHPHPLPVKMLTPTKVLYTPHGCYPPQTCSPHVCCPSQCSKVPWSLWPNLWFSFSLCQSALQWRVPWKKKQNKTKKTTIWTCEGTYLIKRILLLFTFPWASMELILLMALYSVVAGMCASFIPHCSHWNSRKGNFLSETPVTFQTQINWQKSSRFCSLPDTRENLFWTKVVYM